MATESDNVNSGALGTLVAVGTFAMLGISLVVTALVRSELASETKAKEVSADRAYRDLVSEQQALLNAPAAYKDRGRGTVSLPISRAMELTVAGLAKDPNSATPPPPVGGSAGMGGSAAADAGGSGGMGGTGGGTGGEGQPETAPGTEPKPDEALKKEGDKPVEPEKKEAPKPVPAAPAPGHGSPSAPAPTAAPNPAPAAPSPAPAPNGQ